MAVTSTCHHTVQIAQARLGDPHMHEARGGTRAARGTKAPLCRGRGAGGASHLLLHFPANLKKLLKQRSLIFKTSVGVCCLRTTPQAEQAGEEALARCPRAGRPSG